MSDKDWEPEPYTGPNVMIREALLVPYQDEWIAFDGFSSWSYYDTEMKAQHLVNRWNGRGCSYCFAPDWDGPDCLLRGYVPEHAIQTVADEGREHQRAECKCGWRGMWVHYGTRTQQSWDEELEHRAGPPLPPPAAQE